MRRRPRNTCPQCGGWKLSQSAVCQACHNPDGGENRRPQAAYVCPYSDEKRGKFYVNRQFCPSCPDADKIPAECAEWDCEACLLECPCHTPPTDERTEAHDRYWAKHLMNSHDITIGRSPELLKQREAEYRARRREKERIAFMNSRHPCPECGTLIGARAKMCCSCDAKRREAKKRAERDAALQVENAQ